jgi:S-adenosylmethionine:tRNA ribosyltransferase-isomerase
MRREELIFERPAALAATRPAEARGIARDEVRLLVTTPQGHRHARFIDLPAFLRPGDVLAVNDSATLPASLPAQGEIGPFTLNLSTHYGGGLWLAEPRWSPAKQGPLPLAAGDEISAAGIIGRLVAPFPGLLRLWFIRFDSELDEVMAARGEPIRYAYVEASYPLDTYQTIFAAYPGSAEMPSAAYPFTQRVLDALVDCGIELVTITLHTGVSSLEVEAEQIEDQPLYPEAFAVPAVTADAVNTARAEGRRVIAIGTTAVRALESAWDGKQVRAIQGFTRRYIRPETGVQVVDGLLSGLHDPVTSHLAMLYAIAGQERIREAYAEAVREAYLWHEFGDSHLILARD